MKPSEVMIGDYLLDRSGFPKKVDEVLDDGVLLGGVYHHMSEMKDIPTTEEVIEKNGFEKLTDEFGKEYYNLVGTDFCVLYVDNIWWFGQMDCESETHNRPDPIFAVNKVHKLQHALRMCDIEKEVVL